MMIGSLCTQVEYWKALNEEGQVTRYGTLCSQAAPYLVEGNSFCFEHVGVGINPSVTWVNKEERQHADDPLVAQVIREVFNDGPRG